MRICADVIPCLVQKVVLRICVSPSAIKEKNETHNFNVAFSNILKRETAIFKE